MVWFSISNTATLLIKRLNLKTKSQSKMQGDDETHHRERPPCPKEKANFLSVLTFFYSLKVFHRGRKKEFTEDDLTQPLPEHKSSYLGDRISEVWRDEYDKAIEQKRRPRMGRVILRTFIREFLVYGCVIFCMEIPIRLFQPLFVGLFIRYFNAANKNSTEPARYPMYFNRVFSFWDPNQGRITREESFFFAAGVGIINAIVVMTTHPYMLAVLHIGMKVRVACCSLIYRKVLRLKFTSIGGRTVGNVVNLMSNDVTRFDLAAMFVHYLWIAPLQMIFIVYFMYKEVQWSALVGIVAVLVVMPLQMLFGVRTSYLRRKAGARTDERVRQMNEIIQSIQVIKMYAWENAFADLINKLRKNELKVLIQTSYIRGLIMSFIMFTSRSAIFLTIMAYIFLENKITADKTFVIISYYQILRQTMTVYFPQGVAMVAEALVSIKRIEEFMATEETTVGDPSPIDKHWQSKLNVHATKHQVRKIFFDTGTKENQNAIHIIHGIAKYGENICLDDINLDIPSGTLVAVVGPVGAGKSCLLHLIMGELPLFSGTIGVDGVVSYASQEPWLFAGSVRQNILFGREFNYQKYKQVVKVCALNRDFGILQFGDRTIVGERGVSLSGGQRARVNLARCVYKEADIYLLDDPLSAVDIQVGQQLFEGCIRRYLKDKIVVLITHQLQYLKRADHIVIMNEGVIQCQGSYSELMGREDMPVFATVLKDASSAAPIEEKEIEKLLRNISVTSAAFQSMIDIEGKKLLLNLIGAIIVVTLIDYFLLIPTAVIFVAFYLLRRVYLHTSRNVKRLEGITRSPVFAHLNATLQGLTTIRSNGAEKILVEEFDYLQDIHSSAWFMFLFTSRAFGLWLDLICTVFILYVTFNFAIFDSKHYGSGVGLAITQCIGLSGLVQWGMRQSAELENQMTSVERVLEFTRIEHEPDLESTPDKKPPPTWPKFGKIEFIDTTMRYSKTGATVLKHLNFIIKPKEKVGIVGRTGAGKSSLISTIFRLQPYEGIILIDNLDINVPGLHDLRRKISIIPQEPVIFSGTLRYNLDPFGEYTDEQIFAALLDVEIKNAMQSGIDCLNDVMTEGGTNLSVGSRQMVCLARAILRNNRILVLDEATANVDAQTDKFIQTTIRTKFAHCTVLTIAHRLNTVMDSDRLMVLDNGLLIEFDHPHILLQNREGLLSEMVKKTGPGVSDHLKVVAKENYSHKQQTEMKNIVGEVVLQVLDHVQQQ
ncbi:probable multidrug resistance-associated protein lethal(2)03659 isoform X2 [Diabrotica virgifera virgifera]|uniref:Multidrug resistance-associated protein lethal(2)03659 n=1 Tax=Diabrotica virgifera virgifera TaxID=50390 RepID=A0ABM5JZD6_DIAVI|nr:probable multidrug resistance-associated protein lethal(2)03659 isoform X2 [Diabrotica virgifera virgifera]